MSEYVCDCVEYNGWWCDCYSRLEGGREGGGGVDMMGKKHVFIGTPMRERRGGIACACFPWTKRLSLVLNVGLGK